MFDDVKFRVSGYSASKTFFLKALEPLGVAVVSEGLQRTVSSLAQRVRLHCACTKPKRSRRISTWRSRPRIASKSTHSITRLWEAGGKDNGTPLRRHYHANYKAAFVIGSGGHNIEVVYHDPQA
jgi:hypothetical protein